MVSKLEEVSPAYVAYKALQRLPKNSPAFEIATNGYPVLHFGEVKCRMPRRTGVLCGQAFTKYQGLITHLENIHEVPKEARPSRGTRGLSWAEANKIAVFYDELMKDEKHDQTPGDVFAGERVDERKSVLSQVDGANASVTPAVSESGHNANSTDHTHHDETSARPDLGYVPPVPQMLQSPFSPFGTEGRAGLRTTHENTRIDEESEEELKLAVEEAEMQEKLRSAQLCKIQLKRKLAALKKRQRTA